MWPFKKKPDPVVAVNPPDPHRAEIDRIVKEIEVAEKALEPLVKRAIASVRLEVLFRRPALREAFSYGAVGIDPKHLVIWYVFRSESDTTEAKRSGLSADLDSRSRAALRRMGYPAEAIDAIQVCFASDEEIHRAGGFRDFFA